MNCDMGRLIFEKADDSDPCPIAASETLLLSDTRDPWGDVVLHLCAEHFLYVTDSLTNAKQIPGKEAK